MTRYFTTAELKHTKYNLMNRGFSERRAEEEIANMIACNEEAHAKAKEEKQQEKRYKKGRFKEEFRRFKKNDNK